MNVELITELEDISISCNCFVLRNALFKRVI